MSTKPEPYNMSTIQQTGLGTAMPVQGGIALMDGVSPSVVALSDNAFPFGKNDDNTPIYPKGTDWFMDRYYPFLANCQFRIDRRDHYAVPLYDTATIRSLAPKTGEALWLDRQPYALLLEEGDRLVGIHYYDTPYVLIVRNGSVMAAVKEDALPIWVKDAGHCEHEVIQFEKMMELDESLQANALQQAFDYAGRIYDASTTDGKRQVGRLVAKLRPIVGYYESAARDGHPDRRLS